MNASPKPRHIGSSSTSRHGSVFCTKLVLFFLSTLYGFLVLRMTIGLMVFKEEELRLRLGKGADCGSQLRLPKSGALTLNYKFCIIVLIDNSLDWVSGRVAYITSRVSQR